MAQGLARASGEFKRKFGEGKKRKGRRKKNFFKAVFGKSIFRKRRKLFGIF